MEKKDIFCSIYNEANKKKNKVKVIYPQDSKTSPFTSLDNVKNSIFLAGPCPRSNYRATDWREKTYGILENLCFDGYVINPTNENYNEKDPDALKKQTEWEYEAMHKASAIIFNLDRNEEHPGMTTCVEIATYWNYPGIYVYMPDDNKMTPNKYIRIHCEEKGIPIYNTLEDCYAAVVRDLNRPGKVWYTSDTHFGQERTLNFSKRPFKTVREMDLELISNWNKRVRHNDIVYHLGDFGESFDYLNCLNFKTLNFVKGNYEKDKIPEIMKDLKKRDDVNIYDNDECTVDSGEFHYILRHEPVIGKKIPKDMICLHGHIHCRTLVKTNGIDVGVDGHLYAPMSQEDVDFFANAIKQGFYDENVTSMECK